MNRVGHATLSWSLSAANQGQETQSRGGHASKLRRDQGCSLSDVPLLCHHSVVSHETRSSDEADRGKYGVHTWTQHHDGFDCLSQLRMFPGRQKKCSFTCSSTVPSSQLTVHTDQLPWLCLG